MLTVFGSINADISVAAPHLPAAGETVLGGDALLSPGGKGANQAHAARRYGADVRMFGAVGGDAFADPALALLAASGTDISGVARLGGKATGMALIVLDAQGENTIVVAPGANLSADAAQVPDSILRNSGALLLQLETDSRANMALARRARALGCRVILNASPLGDVLTFDPRAADTLIVNFDELQRLAGHAQVPAAEPPVLALALAAHYGNEVLVTLGGQGALLAGADGGLLAAPAMPVGVVDTTGAGDTFAGVYAAAVTQGLPRRQAMVHASAAAALACTRRGAQAAQPSREETLSLLATQGVSI